MFPLSAYIHTHKHKTKTRFARTHESFHTVIIVLSNTLCANYKNNILLDSKSARLSS